MATETVSHGRITWTNITRATERDITHLRAAYPGFHPLDFEDLLSRIERPKIDEYEDYLFVVMHFPVWDPHSRISRATEVDLFIGEGFLVTSHDGVLKPLNTLFYLCQSDEATRDQYMSRSASRLFYAVIDQLVDYILPILYKVDSNIRGQVEDLFTQDLRHTIEDITFVRRDIIALRRIIRPQIALVANLEKVDRPFINAELDVYFGDIVDHMQRAADLLTDHGEVITVLAESADTLASHRINEVMRILTVISFIILPLTLISGIYGMNVFLPLGNHPHAFTIISSGMVLITGVMLIIFRRMRWL